MPSSHSRPVLGWLNSCFHRSTRCFGWRNRVRLALNDVDWITAALACVFFVFVIGVLAGSYPALVLSGFRPTDAIRGTTAITGRRRVTSVLITFQYAMAIALVVGTVVIVSQMRYLESQDLGYSTEQVVVVKLRGEHKVEQGERYKMAISRLPGVINTSLVDRTFTTSYNQTRITNADGDHVKVHQYWVDPDFIETLRIQLVEGRFLNRDRPSDRTESVVVNRAFTKAFGWSDSALGKSVLYNNNGVGGHPLVVGVTEDFHYHGLQERIKPVILQYGPKGTSRFVIVRLETVTGGETLDALGETWRTQNSGLPFDYSFLDEDFARHYRTEEMMHSLITSAAVTAILIACVGLFGQAMLVVVRRTKEIGIRKVLGATVAQILSLLSLDFLRLVVVANVLAWPLVWYAMDAWLSQFAYRVSLSPLLFVLGGTLALALAIVAVGSSGLKAATADPVDSLRYE